MNRSYLSLGSNMGNRFEMLRRAVFQLTETPSIAVMQISSLYETDPVGFTEQEPFLNMVVYLETELDALGLLDVCQEIEQQLNRERIIRWGPRTIDLDILLFNQDEVNEDRLIVPHPRMHERAFVLVPLHELNSEFNMKDSFEQEGVRLWRSYNNVAAFLQDDPTES